MGLGGATAVGPGLDGPGPPPRAGGPGPSRMGAPTEISRGSDKSSGTKIESSALSDCIRIPLVNKAGSVLWVYL